MVHDYLRSRAILIGNSTYLADARITNIPAAKSCVSAMAELLTSDLCRWPATSVVDLVNVETPSRLSSQVYDAVEEAEDVLLVYYVGHGLRTMNGHLALSVGETERHPEKLPHTALLYSNLAEIMRASRAPTKLVILDCCHAELGNKSNFIFQGGTEAEDYPVDGLYFIGASAASESAMAPIDGELTCFSQAFIGVIRDGIPDGPAMLSVEEIFRQLRSRLLSAGLPEPVESGIRGAHRFTFARNAAKPAVSLASRYRLNDPSPDARRAGVAALAQLLWSPDEVTFTAARNEIQQIADHDIPLVANVAQHFLASHPVHETGIGAVGGAPLTDNTQKPASADRRQIESPPRLVHTIVGRRQLVLRDIYDVTFSHNGRQLASAGSDGRARIWDSGTARCLQVLPRGAGAAFCVAFSPNSKQLASSGVGANIMLWNLADGGHQATLNGHRDVVRRLAFSPVGSLLASTGTDKTLRLWDMQSYACLHILPSNSSQGLAFSPDGSLLASGDYEGEIHIWNPIDGQHQRTLSSHSGVVRDVTFSPTEYLLASAGDDGVVRLWDLARSTNQHSLSLRGHSGLVNSVAFSPDGQLLASGGADTTVRLWDPATGQNLFTLADNARVVNRVTFSRRGNLLASGGGDKTIRIWSVFKPDPQSSWWKSRPPRRGRNT